MNAPPDLLERIRRLEAEIQSAFSFARTRVDTFASGAATLDVHLRGRVFIFEYLPSHGGYGVDEVLADDGFTLGYRHSSTDFDEAAEQLRALLRTTETP